MLMAVREGGLIQTDDGSRETHRDAEATRKKQKQIDIAVWADRQTITQIGRGRQTNKPTKRKATSLNRRQTDSLLYYNNNSKHNS